jgi:uncharacterized membrane protein SpoIIM required for sporulation
MFYLIKCLAFGLLIVSLVYGIFSFLTNIFNGESSANSECNNSVYCNFQNNASNRNKTEPQITMIIEWWLGLIYCIFWLIAARMVKIIGKEKDEIIYQKVKRAGDTAIRIKNLPYGQYS